MDLQPLVVDYLCHLVHQIKTLVDEGRLDDALALEDSGRKMACAYDLEHTFLYVEDLNLQS